MSLWSRCTALLITMWGAAPGADHGPLPTATVDGLTLIAATGDAQTMGSDIGATLAQRIRFLARTMSLAPGLLTPERAAQRQDCIAAIRPEHRAEIAATAAAAKLDEATLLTAHLVIETMCSAVAVLPRDGAPLRIARNMDFFPADLLGQQTIIQVWRADGAHAIAAIGWPGFSGVVSGFNERGLSACILLNYTGDPLPPAEPLPLRLRHLLATCHDVESFSAGFAATAVGSSHYVLVADEQHAALLWWSATGMQRHDPIAGFLVADNEPRAADGSALGQRACQLADAARQHPADADWLRRCTSTSFLPGLNAQAMVIEPANRTVALARGGTTTPAAHQAWLRIACAELLAGVPPDASQVTRIGVAEPLPHYTAPNQD